MASSDVAVDIPEDLYPIAVLIDELKHDDVQCRLNSMRKLPIIELLNAANALGPERTRDELVPFLEDGCDDEDEVLLVMAEQLGEFIPHVGGSEHAFSLLSPLQQLATVEESTVRERAVKSINSLLSHMPQEHLEKYGWSLAKRLGDRDWFTSKTSACGILPRCYARLPGRAVVQSRPWALEAKASAAGSEGGMDVDGTPPGFEPGGREDALELYLRLCSPDEVPMVRRAAAAHLGVLGSALAGGDMMQLAETIAAAQSSAEAEASARPQVDTGDMTAASLPPAIPPPILVAASAPAAGGSAVQTLLPTLQAFCRDEQDGVRLLAVEACIAFALLCNGGPPAIPAPQRSPSTAAAAGQGPSAAELSAGAARLSSNSEHRGTVLGLLVSLASDRSWRVRWSVANRFTEACRAFGQQAVLETLLHVFDRLASDSEAEVRTAAAYRVGDLGLLLPKDKLTAVLLPAVNKLAEDTIEPVRAALAAVILGLAPPLGTDTTIASLLPLFLRLLKDSSAQVRLNIISRLEAVNAVIGLKMLSAALLPAITDLSSDKAWRVRHATIEFFPSLARQLGSDVFEASPELLDLCANKWLSDSVCSIREVACTNLKRLAAVFGAEWAERVLAPKVLSYGRAAGAPGGGNYVSRLTGLGAVLSLAEALPAAVVSRSKLLAAVLAAFSDPVPNVRFTAAKGVIRLAELKRIDSPGGLSSIRAGLQGMSQSDPDEDARYYAKKALEAVTGGQ